MMTPKRGDAWVAVGVALWVGAGLWCDHAATLGAQRWIGAATWSLLALALLREGKVVRVQVLVALAIATAGEYALSPGLGLYDYRFAGVPSFVPPGHGLVYLAALNLARSTLAGRAGPWVRGATVVAGGAWAAWGITGAARSDRFGFVLYLAWAAFALRGGAPMIAVGCWILTTWLELVGTGLGNWAWAPATALPWLTMGNPPTGIAGGYCVLDVLSFRIGHLLVAPPADQGAAGGEAGAVLAAASVTTGI
jgi:hypothetical protein